MPMSRDHEPLDSGEQSYRLEDLLKKLKEGRLPGGGHGFFVFNIYSTPRLEGGASISPDGFPETDYGEKFKKDFIGWQHGERVKTRYIVVRRRGEAGEIKFALQVSESVVGDVRHADIFYLKGLTNEDKKALALMGIADMEAVVQIDRRINTERQLDNIQEYTARLDRVVAVQKPWNGDLKELKEGNQYLVEGEVVAYRQNHQYPYDEAEMEVRLKNGKVVKIKLWNGYVKIEDGVIEKFTPEYPVAGDIVQVTTTYANSGERYGKKEPACLFAYFCRSTYLLKPQTERSDSDKMQRRRVSAEIAKIKKARNPEEIRKIVSLLINSSLVGDVLNITEAEQREIDRVIVSRIKDDREKPMDLFDDLWGNLDLRNGYGVDTFGMSRGEYYEFCMHVAKREIRMSGDGSSDTPLRLMSRNLNREQQERVLAMTIASLYSRVTGKKTIHKVKILKDPKEIPDVHLRSYGHQIGNKIVVGYKGYDPTELANPFNIPWEDAYLLHQALNYFSHHTTPDAADIYLILLKNMLEKKFFIKSDSDRLLEYSEYEIVEAATKNVTDNIFWKDNKWGTEMIGFRNNEALGKYIGQIKILKDLARILKREGWKNDGNRNPEKHVEELIKWLEGIDTIMKRSNARLN